MKEKEEALKEYIEKLKKESEIIWSEIEKSGSLNFSTMTEVVNFVISKFKNETIEINNTKEKIYFASSNSDKVDILFGLLGDNKSVARVRLENDNVLRITDMPKSGEEQGDILNEELIVIAMIVLESCLKVAYRAGIIKENEAYYTFKFQTFEQYEPIWLINEYFNEYTDFHVVLEELKCNFILDENLASERNKSLEYKKALREMFKVGDIFEGSLIKHFSANFNILEQKDNVSLLLFKNLLDYGISFDFVDKKVLVTTFDNKGTVELVESIELPKEFEEIAIRNLFKDIVQSLELKMLIYQSDFDASDLINFSNNPIYNRETEKRIFEKMAQVIEVSMNDLALEMTLKKPEFKRLILDYDTEIKFTNSKGKEFSGNLSCNVYEMPILNTTIQLLLIVKGRSIAKKNLGTIYDFEILDTQKSQFTNDYCFKRYMSGLEELKNEGADLNA